MKKLAVFVGTETAQKIAANTLKYSIQKHNPNIDVYFLCDMPSSVQITGRTPFSFQRLLVPKYCSNYENAVYMDSDMLVFGDLYKLLDEAPELAGVYGVKQPNGVRHNQSSFLLYRSPSSLYDPESVINDYVSGALKISYTELIEKFGFLKDGVQYLLNTKWNCLESRSVETMVLHYTDMETQPWLYPAHPLGTSWFIEMAKAVSSGYMRFSEIEEDIIAGHIRPSILDDWKRKDKLDRVRRLYILADLFWYPPGLIPTARPKLWRLMRSKVPPVRLLVALLLRGMKALLFRRERKCLIRILIVSIRRSSIAPYGRGLFDSYE
jgi:hypothetical protein